MTGRSRTAAALVAIFAAGCTSSSHSTPSQKPRLPAVIASCRIPGLGITLGHGGIANTFDFAVFEVRNHGWQPCVMRTSIGFIALGRDGRRVRGVPRLISHPAEPPIVLAPASHSATSAAVTGLNGLGIVVRGGNAIGIGGCPPNRLLRPWSWRAAISDGHLMLRNRTRSVAGALSACRLRGQGFGVDPQTPNARLPVHPHPA